MADTEAMEAARRIVEGAEMVKRIIQRRHESAVAKGLKCPVNLSQVCPTCRPELVVEWRDDPETVARALLAEGDGTGSALREDDGSRAAARPLPSKRSTRSALSAELQAVLAEIEEFLQDQHDIRDGDNGEQLPNKAMSLSTDLKEALGELP